MGIFGLQTYMVKSCKGGCENVSLREIANLYRCETGKDPIMFYEISSCVTDFHSDLLEKLACADLKKYKKNIELLIDNLFKCGINLKVVFDGFRRRSAYNIWAGVRTEFCANLKKFFLGEPLDLKTYERYSVLCMYLVSELVFRTSDKCEFIRGIHGGDEYIINYIKKFNCFAVLTNDSNFILVDGAEYCLSSRHLDLNTMTTYNYNRKHLANDLDISISQLPLFGSLHFANDYDEPSLFFEKKIKHNRFRFRTVTEMVKKLPLGEEILQKKMSNDFKEVLEMDDKDLARWIKRLKFFHGSSEFELNETVHENWNEILSEAQERHIKGAASVIYEVLSQEAVYLFPDFSNVLKPMPDVALAPLRRNFYGILFYEYPYSKLSVTEHSFKYCEDIGMAKGVTETVTVRRVKHPGLLKMWCSNPSPEIQKEKRQVFLNAIDPKLTFQDIEDIEEELLFPFLAIFYLLWKSKIKLGVLEGKVLLIQAVLANSLSEEEIDEYTLELNAGAVDLSCWFVKTISLLWSLNFACGEPFCLNKTNLVNYFDGKILHHVYNSEITAKKSMDLPEDFFKKLKFLESKLLEIAAKCYLNYSKHKLFD